MPRSSDWDWRFWWTVPLYPYNQRRTLRRELVKDTIWAFDQLQGILYTVVPIRMTVVALATGGLLIYAPVAPTRECIQLMQELITQYGEVKYILLPTASGLEHKVFVGPFARCFPTAQVFVAPHQWSFPFNLPLSWLGFPRDRTQILPEHPEDAPFAAEFNYAILDIDLGRGAFVEVALLHKRSRTLLLTDSILAVPAEPPAIAQLDPYPLLFHARDSALESIADTPDNRRKGWQRIALFAIYFRPAAIETVNARQALRDAFHAPDHSRKSYWGLYPFRWRDTWHYSFEALRSDGRPFVAPVLQTLILVQDPKQVLAWADQIATWDFQHIIPCHFDALISTTPQHFRHAFAFLDAGAIAETSATLAQLPNEDVHFIKQLEANLIKRGIATPSKL